MILFNKRYFIAFLLLLSIEIIIAIFIKQGFIRFVFGDFLVVIMLYYFFKNFVKINSLYIAITVLIIAFSIEFLQLIDVFSILNIPKNTFTKLVLGTTFNVEDLIAYTLGITTILMIDATKTPT